jgi:uncharacterized protein (UPF0332 family)
MRSNGTAIFHALKDLILQDEPDYNQMAKRNGSSRHALDRHFETENILDGKASSQYQKTLTNREDIGVVQLFNKHYDKTFDDPEIFERMIEETSRQQRLADLRLKNYQHYFDTVRAHNQNPFVNDLLTVI